ncbi:SDR family NAD(P)-dependent oxidoreductase [Acinetobacter modestus]|uniref:SDR family NAD(P)-dependent oxidoreductase n=1 Tax=Acinetobacter modestus TaxID=1776740 RepID=UPI002030DD60|nr:SDR family NAD(P)-dependent oxidoreductase [Acinetobacter modestus]MCM1959077.1 SDR family NAD(P)-dependent oxidoreductase [Acinetobacter modestus]
MTTFNGKVIAITGAASGIGRATAQELARLGASLSISDVNEMGLEETRRFCAAQGADVLTRVLSVSDREAIEVWAAETVNHFGHVNVILNNAGVSLAATVADLDYENFEWLMGINFWGVVYGTKAFLPYLRQSGDGHVVNVSSLFGLMAMPTASAYNASKFAVRGFTEALAQELAIEGACVRATSVHPGGIDTNIAGGGRVVANAAWHLSDATRSAQDFKRLARTTPAEAASEIISVLSHPKRRLLIGTDAKLFDLMQRTMPQLYQSVVVRVMKKQLMAGKTI